MNSPPDSCNNSTRGQPRPPSEPWNAAAMSSTAQPDLSRAQPRGPPSPSSTGTAIVAATGSVNEEGLYANVHPDGQYDLELDGIDTSNYGHSLTSNIRAHVYEGGLRYHAYRDGKYAFPNDEVEQDRDDMKHAMTVMLCKGKHFYAPVDEALRNGGEVLDLGTGTGMWCLQLAEDYTEAVINGTDLSPIQPNEVPDNVYFIVDDFEDEWVEPENHYDFIHVRHTIHSIRDRKTLLERIFRHLKPGGYVEFQELHYKPHCDDETMTPSTPYAFRDFLNFLDAGLLALGSEMNSILGLPDELRETGFDDVTLTTHKCPIGVWPDDKRLRLCGLFLRTAIMDGLRGLVRRPFGHGLGWTSLQIEVFLVDVRKAAMDASFHTYMPLHILYARKPPS